MIKYLRNAGGIFFTKNYYVLPCRIFPKIIYSFTVRIYSWNSINFVVFWCSFQFYNSLNVSVNVHWFIVSLLTLIVFIKFLRNEHLRRKP